MRGHSQQNQRDPAGEGNRECGTELERAGHRAVHGGKGGAAALAVGGAMQEGLRSATA
jgi:hypothetical protein